MEWSRLTVAGKMLAAVAVAAMIGTAWLAGARLHAMNYGGGCVLLATCGAGVAAFAGGWATLRCAGVRIAKCRRCQRKA
jgi:hypothetical protein